MNKILLASITSMLTILFTPYNKVHGTHYEIVPDEPPVGIRDLTKLSEGTEISHFAFTEYITLYEPMAKYFKTEDFTYELYLFKQLSVNDYLCTSPYSYKVNLNEVSLELSFSVGTENGFRSTICGGLSVEGSGSELEMEVTNAYGETDEMSFSFTFVNPPHASGIHTYTIDFYSVTCPSIIRKLNNKNPKDETIHLLNQKESYGVSAELVEVFY